MQTPVLDTSFIYRSLSQEPPPQTNKQYCDMVFASRAKEGSIAFVFEPSDARVAISRGAALLVTEQPIDDFPHILVEDVTKAFALCGKRWKEQFSAFTVAITGSIGKSTTTQMIQAIFENVQIDAVLTSEDNLNTSLFTLEIVQRLNEVHKFYIQEVAENPIGETSTQSKMISPNIGVITKVGASHMEIMGSIDNIAKSCFDIQDGLTQDGLLIVNTDDSHQIPFFSRLTTPFITYGLAENADYRADNIKLKQKGVAFDLHYEGTTIPIQLGCIGEHNVSNALAAFAAAKAAGISDADIQAGLSAFKTSHTRQNLITVGKQRIFLDCFNASVESFDSAFKALSSIPLKGNGQYVALLGGLSGAGEHIRELSEQYAKVVSKQPLKHVFFLDDSREGVELTANLVKETADFNVYYSKDIDDYCAYIRSNITEDDVLLVKGYTSGYVSGMSLIVDKIFGTWFHEQESVLHISVKEKEVTHGDFLIRMFVDHGYVKKYTGSDQSVEIPSHVNGVPITGIGKTAFAHNSTIEHVTLPDTIRNIRYSAFYQSTSLKSITVSKKLNIVGQAAFSGCSQLETFDGGESELLEIRRYAFANCTAMKKLIVSNATVAIRKTALFGIDKSILIFQDSQNSDRTPNWLQAATHRMKKALRSQG